ncbi:Hypothetical protein SMAX5B_010975 [Scophthalmus maximus]|uniref:Uncharacterized protein n=1 Tax=Scophthalmus maximus TaxID=52904 RepID=A0A2U9BTH7_SCOMX|nr:Hypothetical protein SMAX5B_010975 [Scophthalmus maximus]
MARREVSQRTCLRSSLPGWLKDFLNTPDSHPVFQFAFQPAPQLASIRPASIQPASQCAIQPAPQLASMRPASIHPVFQCAIQPAPHLARIRPASIQPAPQVASVRPASIKVQSVQPVSTSSVGGPIDTFPVSGSADICSSSSSVGRAKSGILVEEIYDMIREFRGFLEYYNACSTSPVGGPIDVSVVQPNSAPSRQSVGRSTRPSSVVPRNCRACLHGRPPGRPPELLRLHARPPGRPPELLHLLKPPSKTPVHFPSDSFFSPSWPPSTLYSV